MSAFFIGTSSPAEDRDVPGLRAFWPEARRRKSLARLFGEHRLATARFTPLSNRLGRPLVSRLDRPDGGGLLKLHAPERVAQAQAGALAETQSKRPDRVTAGLHSARRAAGRKGRSGDGFGVREMKAGPEGLRVCPMERVPGQPLSEWRVPGANPVPFHMADQARAAFHAAPVSLHRVGRPAEEHAFADRATTTAVPKAADRIARLRMRAESVCAPVPVASDDLLHRSKTLSPEAGPTGCPCSAASMGEQSGFGPATAPNGAAA